MVKFLLKNKFFDGREPKRNFHGNENKKFLIVKKQVIITTIQVSLVIKNLFKMEGISNKILVNCFAEKTNDDIKKWLVFFLLTI